MKQHFNVQSISVQHREVVRHPNCSALSKLIEGSIRKNLPSRIQGGKDREKTIEEGHLR